MEKRKYTRLKNYDYRLPGAYFITVCTRGRESTLGHEQGGLIVLSALGLLVEQCLLQTSAHFGSHITIHSYVVMPNHIHFIVFIHADPVTFKPILKEPTASKSGPGGVAPGSLGAIVGSFKAAVTRLWREHLNDVAELVWQVGFYEHVIRHEEALLRIHQYILDNPRQWQLDRENPECSKASDFYRWLEQYHKWAAGVDFVQP